MPYVPFTKDEAILALDVLYFSGKERVSPNSETIQELSHLLSELPIISPEKRGKVFRSCGGISQQINTFQRSYQRGLKEANVGSIFYKVANEYIDNLDELHDIAQTIKRNREFFRLQQFGSEQENDGFKEGALLGHLHRILERRDSARLKKATVCEVCLLNLGEVYRDTGSSFLQMHLLEPITKLDASKKYTTDDFMTVCPNCHAVLHRHRPWATRETVRDILR